ncbi:hypothetical protein FRC08_015077 [Ceratobasidium sp. 394]|nr:hypothetical protein FRC08_015077 [Ceratobasidium sp. 394]
MGKSAKLHKRKGKTTSSFAAQTQSQTNPSVSQPQADKASDSKKKAEKSKLKPKTKSTRREGHILEGADYVTLMMGGRAKARQELKLPLPE